ncbi:type IV secretion/conjugal transfer ATPase, VirB4 family protein [Neorickettsia helminthoeca str. Oregon]|uniref:Type IV secretion system protein virB4 n=1 Tax=Neorickettsia helminthoeca str. Oregon TaxID=1286528 RepID=X5HMN7_9RICK|nr:VirB4 family type IV secretion/conjugal transfer ATPase [Neorickettsia helminthoeca]AHX11745.1 type IV secretion/conjugal transfer ATPase, VirB4 family protein [Neorickettsia helminthoeca str. Oregon]
MFKFSSFKNYKSKVASSEFHSRNFVPYKEHLDSNTVLLKDNSMLRVIKLVGYPFETADDEDVDINKSIRNQLFKSVSVGHFALSFHLIRRRESNYAHSFFSARMPNHFGDYVRKRWRQKYSNKSMFVNELYISIVRRNDKKIEFLNDLYRKITRKDSKEGKIADLKVAHEELEEMTNKLLISLRNNSPSLLGLKKVKGVMCSEVFTFLSKIANCGIVESDLILPTGRIDESLVAHRMYFGRKSIEIVTPSGSRYAGIVSLKEYGQNTSAGMLDAFLQIPYEVIITQTFQFVNRQVAINKMQVQQSRMLQTQDKAVSQVVEISRALDDAMSGRIAFGLHHLTILCCEKTEKGLENVLSLVESELTNTGVYAVREKINLEPAFWAQLPGNFDYIVRKATISTLNLAGFASQHNYPIGKKKGNHWGDAVTIFDTTSGTPFYFNFHSKDVGHTLIIGPTGSGKTVLLNFLCAQSMKFRPRMFFFDKDRGAEIFIRALGGIYTVIEPRTRAYFNPLQLDDTPENRTFLVEWLKTLASSHEEKFTATDAAILNDAIVGNFKLDKTDRTLGNLSAFFGLEGDNTLATRLLMWYGSGSHASLFDNTEDRLDFSKASVFGFEMGQLLKDPVALAPVLLYLFHRISISLDGAPSMIILDEAWALIDNSVFAPTIKDWLKVLRKLNTFVVFATQSVEDASKSAISDTLVQQTATQIFLPNLKATDVYRSVFMLSEREYALIKNTDPATRFFLIKQGMSAVIARINLAGMEDIISVLSGRAETVVLLHEIIKEYGEDPLKWLPIFYEQAKELS